ncbi:olfactory receptor 1361-like [Suricata suricatta]|uniref:olfactory receptor 1361-like n=1 Tax=Suricata suricatta TaxID=37032 RepID=UPI001155E3DE|nr:olfactory receptor 1361-like [Suricata suricatta]
MDRDNQTMVTEFFLLELSGKLQQEEVLFGLFMWMYLVTIIGNVLIVLAISCDSHLHTPMYFFLASLSCIDICFSSVTTPKMLLNHMMGSKSISYVECMIQIYFFITSKVGYEKEDEDIGKSVNITDGTDPVTLYPHGPHQFISGQKPSFTIQQICLKGEENVGIVV